MAQPLQARSVTRPAVESIAFHGAPALRLATADGSSAIVMLHGAQVVSWIPAGGEERLYLSERARYGADTSIRGGVPVIFPQFSDFGPLPRHGFARICEWAIAETRHGTDFAVATLRLADSGLTRATWPHPFAAELTVAVGAERMDIELEVENPGRGPFRFTCALHTYLRVAEVETVRLEGLRGKRFRDQVGGREGLDRADWLDVSEEIDRIYFGVADSLLLREPKRTLRIQSESLPDVVVWNPWEEKCARLPDMPRDGFRRMLCVEAAAIERPVTLAPGESWWGRQALIAS